MALPELTKDLRSQLVEIGLNKPHYDLRAASIIIGNIFALESHGQMVSDEYNGLQLVYA
jgi:hypothetical protein